MGTTRAVDTDRIGLALLQVRRQNVMIDSDLAALYGVEVKVLNQAVRRNRARFPLDFMFQLSADEAGCLRSQIVTAKMRRGGRRTRPYAFTEQGVAMLSSVLRSPRAVRVNIEIMRAFVQVRRMLGAHQELSRKIDALEERYDDQFRQVFRAVRALIKPPRLPRRRIGFRGGSAALAATARTA